jgi:hypothetical protein
MAELTFLIVLGPQRDLDRGSQPHGAHGIGDFYGRGLPGHRADQVGRQAATVVQNTVAGLRHGRDI